MKFKNKSTMNKSDKLARLKQIQDRLSGDLDFFVRMELKDEELLLKRELGLVTPPEPGEDCVSCSG
jgi:hypothetical protein